VATARDGAVSEISEISENYRVTGAPMTPVSEISESVIVLYIPCIPRCLDESV